MNHEHHLSTAPDFTKPKRAKRANNGWTPRLLAAFRKLLREFRPAYIAHFTPPPMARLKRGTPCLEALKTLARAMRDFARNHGYKGFWCVFLEDGKSCGYHFHAWFTERPTKAFVEALEAHWLRTCKVPNNKQHSFKYEEVQDVGKMISYFGKDFDGRTGFATKETFRRWGLQSNVHPYRTGGTRRIPLSRSEAPSDSHSEACRSHSEVPLPGSLHTHSEAPPSVNLYPQHTVTGHPTDPILEAKRSSSTGSASLGGPQHVYREEYGLNSSRGSVRVGVRVSPRYGRHDEPIFPAGPGAIEHIRNLADRWECLAVEDAGPLWGAGSLEATFLIPLGGVVMFEGEAAPVGGFARVFRK